MVVMRKQCKIKPIKMKKREMSDVEINNNGPGRIILEHLYIRDEMLMFLNEARSFNDYYIFIRIIAY